MKKLLTFLTLLSISLAANAGSGKAMMPVWGASGSSSQAYIYISNISDNVVEVTVTFYGKDGTKYNPTTFSNFTSGSQLAGKTSGYVSINQYPFNHGFATVEWENVSGDDAVALLAFGHRVAGVSGGRSIISIPINNGLPF